MPDLCVRPNDRNEVCIRIAPDHGLESAVIGDDTAFKINWKLYTWLKCTAEVNRREISQLVERL